MAGERIASLIKQAKPREKELSDIVYGRVISTSPLLVEVEGRFKIGKEHLVLSQTVQDLTLKFKASGEEISLQVFRDLKTGDKVAMLRSQKGQLYYILDRRP